MLIVTGIRMAFKSDDEFDGAQNPIVKLARRVLPFSQEYNGQKFFTIENGRRLARTLTGATGENVPSPKGLQARPFTVSLRRTFAETPSRHECPLRLRLPMPVVDDHLPKLTVEPWPAGARLFTDRIEFASANRDDSLLEIGARYSFVARAGLPSGAKPLPPHPWLDEREGEIQVTERVRGLARDLAGGLPPPAALDAFRNFALDELRCGYIHYDSIGEIPAPDWVLDKGWFDCRLGAALIASLCRARDIPARLVGGYLLWEAPAEHYWMEAWLPDQGWTPYDLLAWGLSAGGADSDWRHIYAGWTDYRMKTQVFPRHFTGAPGVPVPKAIHRLHRRVEGGTEVRILNAENGREIYTDTIRVTG
jgi:hypothetical protein